MKYTTPLFRRPNARALAASLIAYLMLAAPLAPLAAPRNAGAPRPASPVSPAERQAAPGPDAAKAAPAPVPAPLAAASLVVTKTDTIVNDVGNDGIADPGQTITYTVTITNNGNTDATNVTLTDTVDSNTTLQAGTVMSTPIGFDDAYNVIGNVGITVPDGANDLLANDTDPDNAGNSNTGLTVSAIGTDNSAPFSFTTANGGLVESSTTDGAFTYKPAAGFNGEDTFTYTTVDGTGKTNTATAKLTVGPAIWFVDDSAAPDGDGTLAKPFNCYTGASVANTTTCFSDTAADDPGDIIFLFAGTYTGGYTLLNNQRLLGQGMSATLASAAGVTAESYTDTLPATNNDPSTVTLTTTAPATNAVNLGAGNSNTLRGFTGGNTTGADIASTSSGFGTLTVSEVVLNGNGQALNLDSGALAATFVSISSNTSGAQGINLDQVTGTLTATGGTTVTDPTTQCVLVTASTADINFNNTSCSDATDGISLQNNSSGTRTFGTLTVTGGSGFGFNHSGGGGTTNVTGATSITNPAGAGINIQNSTTSVTFAGTTVNKGGSAGNGVALSTNTGNTTFGTLAVTTSNGIGLTASEVSGLITVTTALGSSINATGNAALNVTKMAGGTPLSLNFTQLSSTNSSTAGVNLNGVSGSLSSGATTAGGATGPLGNGIQVANATGGPFNFGNTSVTGSAAAGVVVSNSSAAVGFGSLDIAPDANVGGLLISNSGGTVSSSSGTISTTDAAAISVNVGALNLLLTSVSANNDGDNESGVTLTGATGTLTMNGGSIVGGTVPAFDVSGGSVNSTYSGNISQAAGARIVRVAGTSGGTVAFNTGTVTSTGSSTGIEINDADGNVSFANYTHGTSGARLAQQAVTITDDSNAAPTYNLGAVSIFTSGAQGIVATNLDGTLNATGVINTTANAAGATAAALNINGPGTLTTLGLNFTTVSANNSTNGILIEETNGSFTATGGTISNITNRGASFITATNVSLSNMTFTNVGTVNGADPTSANGTCGGLQSGTNTDCNAGIHANGLTGLTLTNVDLTTGAQQGINGNNLTNLVMSDVNVSEFGNQVNENGIRINNLLGASSMTSVHVFNNSTSQVEIQNESGTLSSFNVTSSEFNHAGTASPANGVDGMNFSAQGTAVMNINVQSSNFHDTGSDGFFSTSAGSASMNITLNQSTFERFGSIGVHITKQDSANVSFNITNNTIRDVGSNAGGFGHGININRASPSTNGTTIQGTISNNTIGEATDTADTNDKGSGIRIIGVSQGTTTVTVHNNNIQDFRERGIFVQSSDDNSGNNFMNLNITNNTVNLQEAVAEHGMLLNTAENTGNAGTTCLNLTGNNSITAGVADGIRVRVRNNGILRLPGYGGGATDDAAAEAFVEANNPATPVAEISVAQFGLGQFQGGAACATPSGPAVFNANSVKADAQPDSMQSPVQHEAAPAEARTATGERQAPSAMGGGVTSRPFIAFPAAPAAQPKRNAGAPRLRHTEADSALSVEGADEARLRAQKKPQARTVKPRIKDVPTPNAPVISGNQITWNVGTLPAGKSVTITFDVVIENPFDGSPAQVSNQATVTADGGISVFSDDPTENPGTMDPTVTPVAANPDLFIRDAEGSEPGELLFTVVLSAPASGTVTVDYATMDGTATVAAGDYAADSGTITFNSGEQMKTIAVSVLSDASPNESPETMKVMLSNASGANIAGANSGTATGTITEDAPPGTLLVSELRTTGPGGGGDWFVEVYNNTDSQHTVQAPGYGLFKKGADCNATPVLVGTIPAGTIIPARGHYLFTGAAYSLENYGGTGAAAADLEIATDLGTDSNVGLFETNVPLDLSTATRFDAVGFGGNATGNCRLLREGTNLGGIAGFETLEHTYFRKLCDFIQGVGCQSPGTPKDTGDNAGDFAFADTSGTTVPGTGQRLGAPGPENLGSPRKSDTIAVALLDSTKPGSQSPNRVRDLMGEGNNPSYATNGTMSIRRRIINNTGSPVSRLRFRISEMTTFPITVSGTADLRAITSGATTASGVLDAGTCAAEPGSPTPACTVNISGTTLETPPVQPVGGGLNATYSVTLGAPLAPGASINVQFLLGVQQSGTFRFLIVTEALP